MKPTINLCSYILFIFVEFHVAQSLVFCVVFYESTFVFLSFLVRTMYCLSFWQLRFLMTSLTFSMTSIDLFWFWFFAGHVYNMIPISCREFRIGIRSKTRYLWRFPGLNHQSFSAGLLVANRWSTLDRELSGYNTEILANVLGKWQAPCMLSLSFVDLRNEHVHCSRYKRLQLSRYPILHTFSVTVKSRFPGWPIASFISL